ncbi:hypothetical protein GGI20_004907 [Coemansia sp. BCRC 34301]|nr:hypothetical protein GGI20_004907 [Coemansia sp. BCRC 34301]
MANGNSIKSDQETFVRRQRWQDMVPIIQREVGMHTHVPHPRIGIVYSVEHWDLVERLVNELRYELKNQFHINVLCIKLMQSESIHEIPLYVTRMQERNQIVFAVGVELMSSPGYEPRLVDLMTRRIDALSAGGRLPVFDCILVRESREMLERQMQILNDADSCFAESWAKRAIDAYTTLR